MNDAAGSICAGAVARPQGPGVTQLSREDAVEAVRARTDITELIGRYLKLRKVGSRYVGLCPFHAEKTPSFSVNAQKGFFHCFGCKESGDAFTFLMRMEGKSFPEALSDLAARVGVALPERNPADVQAREQKRTQLEILQRASRFFEKQLWDSQDGVIAREYIKRRGVVEELAKRFRLGYAPAGWHVMENQLRQHQSLDIGHAAGLIVKNRNGYHDMFRNRLTFPILGLDDQVHGFGARKLDEQDQGGKYINSPQGLVFDKSKLLYGLHCARQAIQKADRVILVEGNIDVISLVGCGIEEVVATCGTSLTPSHAQLLARFCSNVITVFDADTAGQKATEKATALLLSHGLSAYMLQLPQGEDPDSFVQKYGAEAFVNLVEQAKPTLEVLADRLAEEAGDHVEHRAKAVKQLIPLLEAIEDHVRRGAYLQQIARRFRVDERDLRREIEGGDNKRANTVRLVVRNEAKLHKNYADDEIRLVAVLLLYPELVQSLPMNDLESGFGSQDLAELYKKVIKQTIAYSPSTLLADLDEDLRSRVSEEMMKASEWSSEQALEHLDLPLRKIRAIHLHKHQLRLRERIERARREGQTDEYRTLRTSEMEVARQLKALGLPIKQIQ